MGYFPFEISICGGGKGVIVDGVPEEFVALPGGFLPLPFRQRLRLAVIERFDLDDAALVDAIHNLALWLSL